MREVGSVLAAVLLLAGAAHALNTVSPLHDKGWEQAQQSLVGSVASLPGGLAGVAGQSPATPGLSGGTLEPPSGADPDLRALRPDHLVVSSTRAAEGGVEPPVREPIEDAGDAAHWTTGQHWSTDPRRYSDVGFLNASSHVDLPAFTDIGWETAPSPAPRRTSVLEIIILPALAAVLLIVAAALLVLRRRRRKPVDSRRYLLRV